MAWYGYEGMTPGQTAISGQLEAKDREAAEDALREMLIEVRSLHEVSAPSSESGTLGAEDLLFFNEQLASLSEAGLALDDGLEQLARDVESPGFRKWVEELVADMRQGMAIDEAIARREKGLPLLYSRVVRAGIASGNLPATLMNLNQHLRLAGTTRRLIWEAIAYPLVVSAMALSVLSLFFIGVTPRFKEIFTDFGTELPYITLICFAIGDVYPYLLAGLVVVIVVVGLGWQSLRLTKWGRALRDGVLIRIPLLGSLVRASLLARFMRGAATAVGSHLPLPEAVRLASGATGSELLGKDADVLAADVERGESVFASTRKLALIPPIFGFSVETAMQRGTLPLVLGQLAKAYEQRALHSQSMIRALLFPFMLIVVGVLIGGVVIALFLPMVRLINAVSFGGF